MMTQVRQKMKRVAQKCARRCAPAFRLVLIYKMGVIMVRVDRKKAQIALKNIWVAVQRDYGAHGRRAILTDIYTLRSVSKENPGFLGVGVIQLDMLEATLHYRDGRVKDAVNCLAEHWNDCREELEAGKIELFPSPFYEKIASESCVEILSVAHMFFETMNALAHYIFYRFYEME